MHSPLERFIRRLTPAERMTALVCALIISAMLSAVALDRMLQRPAGPVLITVARPAAAADDVTPTSALAYRHD
jgi:hypothetical protein